MHLDVFPWQWWMGLRTRGRRAIPLRHALHLGHLGIEARGARLRV